MNLFLQDYFAILVVMLIAAVKVVTYHISVTALS